MPRNIPTATYRMQFRKDFTFDDAAALVPYLKSLGISHLYASPFLKARAGSTHGYDIVDHSQLNPEIGGEEGFERLARALEVADIGLILDFVPNHMGVGKADNAWWLDVLEWGQRSPHARSFDIDWETLPFKPEGGVLLPILGKPYGDALEAGEITLAYDPAEGSFSAWYYENRLPIRPNRYGDILRTVVAAAGAEGEAAGRRLIEIANLYPDPRAPSREQAPDFKRSLAQIDGAAEIIERGLHAYRPSPDDPAPVTALHRLLERQHYRVASWRVAVSEINYRRFFDVNDLAGLRVEDQRTFTAVHRLVVRLVAAGRLHGLRLDHIDGLADPMQYCERLARVLRAARPKRAPPFYVLVEKILGEGEPLPQFPGVAGTTGYEWLNVISRVLVDARGMPALDAVAAAMTGDTQPFEDVLDTAKQRVLRSMFASEFTVLARLLARIAAGHWRTRDFTDDRLRAALELFVTHFPVYRTYVTADGPSDADRKLIGDTIATARAHWPGPDFEIFDFLQDALTLDLIGPDRQGYSRPRVQRFALKVQQLTGPMMAKSLEDTAFYRYFHLLALNEVGGDPTAPEQTPADFHGQMAERAKVTPHGLTATATHDTKRGEDARARILALSEMTQDWAAECGRWAALNAGAVETVGRRRIPSRPHEYMFYQALIGAWPPATAEGGAGDDFAERMAAFVVKAAREGKRDTSWINPDEIYERGFVAFVHRVLDRARSAQFIAAAEAFASRTALLGALNGLVQLALKATMPGVPDFYQGTEFWDHSLVDPDNRRPVDYATRQAALQAIGDAPDWAALASQWEDGHIKLALTRRLLALRQRHADIFTHGPHLPLQVSGTDAGNVLAYARGDQRYAVITIVGRHFAGCTDGGRRWANGAQWDAAVDLTGWPALRDGLRPDRELAAGLCPVGPLFEALPVAILEAGSPPEIRRETVSSRRSTGVVKNGP